jgi:hypothetical protein
MAFRNIWFFCAPVNEYKKSLIKNRIISELILKISLFWFQLRPGYVVCSFVFLLLGLAALSSSINLLVLRFMILSLEEEEQVWIQILGFEGLYCFQKLHETMSSTNP